MSATDTSLHYFFEAKGRLTGKVGAGGVASTGSTTIPHTFVGLDEGDAYVVTVNRTNATGTTKNPVASTETFIGKVSSTNFINCIRAVEGTAQAWAADTVLEILVTATGWNKMITGIELEHNQDGTHKTASVVTPTGTQTLTNKTLTSPTLTTPTIASFANANHNHTNSAGGATLGETALSLADNTTNDVSITKHGFTPKAPNDTTKFLRGDATWATVTGGVDGWTAASDTWTYASATTFTIAGQDRTSTFVPGTKLKLTQTTAKYFYVVSSSFSTDTTVTITGGSDYSLANAAITSPSYSHASVANAFPGWLNYTPTLSGSGSMTYTTTTISTAKFSIQGRMCTVLLNFTGTTGGTLDNAIKATVPVGTGDASVGVGSYVKDTAAGVGFGRTDGTGVFEFLKSDETNFGSGAGRIIRATISYRI